MNPTERPVEDLRRIGFFLNFSSAPDVSKLPGDFARSMLNRNHLKIIKRNNLTQFPNEAIRSGVAIAAPRNQICRAQKPLIPYGLDACYRSDHTHNSISDNPFPLH